MYTFTDFYFSLQIIRRSNYTEKVLVVVKFRNGHKCATSWIVVCLVAWEGIPQSEADLDYTLLSHKLNRYGLPTTRRCATNENRTCACQGKYTYGYVMYLPRVCFVADSYYKFLFLDLQDLTQKRVVPPTVSAAPGPCITMDASTPVQKQSASSDFRSKLRRAKSRSASTYWRLCLARYI